MEEMKKNGKELVEINFNGLFLNIVKSTWEAISPENQETIMKFDRQDKRLNHSKETRINHSRMLIRLARDIDKSFKDMTREDINGYIDSLDVSSGSRVHYSNVIRVFLKWLYDDDNPIVIKDLKGIKGESVKIKASELISEDEMLKIIDSFQDVQQKAIVSVLYDSACRVGELVNLDRRDVINNNGRWSISVDGKTGIRTIPLIFSSQYLEQWFDKYHPAKDYPDAPLWISRSARDKYKPVEKQRIGRNAVWRILKQGEKLSGIQKKLHPHILRHSRLSSLSDKGLPENMMREYAGWVGGSTMPAVYLHTTPQKIANKLRELDGDLTPEEIEPKRSKLLPIECPRCHNRSPAGSKYCSQCWLPLDIQVNMEELMMLEFLRSPMGISMRGSTKLAKELGLDLPFDVDKKLQIYEQAKASVKEKLLYWNGSKTEKKEYLEKVKKFFGNELIESWTKNKQ